MVYMRFVHTEEGRERGWKGSMDAPRGAHAQIDDKKRWREHGNNGKTS